MNAFVHEKRGSMSPRRIAEIFARDDGRCQECKRKLRPGDDYEVDHIIALSKGGTDENSNLQILCSGCHAIKTPGDISDAAKSKRTYTKSKVPNRYKVRKFR